MAKMNDKDAILEAYADVRDDKTETNWSVDFFIQLLIIKKE